MEDVQIYIKSRYGLLVDRDVVAKALVDLAGEPRIGGNETEYLDIPILVSLLFIPHLLRMQQQQQQQQEIQNNNAEGSSIVEQSDLEENQVKDDVGDDNPFENVLKIIIDDLRIKDFKELVLDTNMLRNIFETYGEENVCEKALQEMINIVKDVGSKNDNGQLILDAETFSKALTNDLNIYQPELEIAGSSLSQDFRTMCSLKDSDSGLEDSNGNEEIANKKFTSIYTASNIDLSADRMQSDNALVIFLLLVTVYTMAYFSGYGYIDGLLQCSENGNHFGCYVVAAIGDWLYIFFAVGVLCSVTLYTVGIDENIHGKYQNFKQFFGLCVMAYFIFVPLVPNRKSNPLFNNESRYGFEWAAYFVVGTGIILLVFQITALVRHIFPGAKKNILALECVRRRENCIKIATRYKVNKIYEHSIHLHLSPSPNETLNEENSFHGRSSSQKALLQFEKLQFKTERVNAYSWGIWKSLDHFIYKEYGVWVGIRVWAANLAQIVVTFTFTFLLFRIHRFILQTYEDNPINIAYHDSPVSRALYYNESGSYVFDVTAIDTDFLSQNNLIFAYPFDTGVQIRQETVNEKIINTLLHGLSMSRDMTAVWGVETFDIIFDQLDESIYNVTGIHLSLASEYVNLYLSYQGNFVRFVIDFGRDRVTANELSTALIVGGVFGVLAMIFVAYSYYPSAISQILLLRHGGIMSPLKDESFQHLRTQAFAPSSLFGGSIWGALATGLATFTLIGAIVFFSIWSQTSQMVVLIIAQLIGLTVTIIIRALIICTIHGIAHTAFYRKKPLLSNIVNILLECWSVGTAFGIIIG